MGQRNMRLEKGRAKGKTEEKGKKVILGN